ncbi:hypothetical protein M3D48_03070 [Dermabacter vaginalis]|uniref:hypothetical protein n=1 Tax=Dermabacter vaginalis TaxID=1630135 RepID=UPI0021A94117|nr:hypothetical protein [Dermabacter vaginalis]MCT2149607.1 hypothetical protein [Dermabacter vaginalis]
MSTHTQLPTESREEIEARIARDRASLKLLKDNERFLHRHRFEIEALTLEVLCKEYDEAFKQRVNETRQRVSEHLWAKHLEELEAKREARERETQERAEEA